MRKPVFCGHDCGGDACPLLADVEGGRVVGIAHNPAAGPYIRGCRRGYDLPKFHYAAERLTVPLVRTGPRGSGRYRETGWDEALSLAASRLGDIRAKHGNASILSLASAGSIGALHSTQTLTARFLNAGGGCTSLRGNYSSQAAGTMLPWLFGSEAGRSGFDACTMRHSKLIILWGANILDTRLGAEMPSRLMEASGRGVPIVVIDPRRTATARLPGARWIPVRPGTDIALMLAILNVLFEEGLADEGFYRSRATGLDALRAEARDPEWAQGVTGVDAAAIRDLARLWAGTKPAMLVPGYSIQRVRGGEDAIRLTVALQLATGNFGLAGGSTGSLNNRLPAPRMARIGDLAPEGGAAVPTLRWPEAVLGGVDAGFPSDIRGVYVAGSNLLNQGGDLGASVRAMESVEFSVCHEMFLTPTARWCDLILPVATPLEKEDMCAPWAGNYMLYKEQLVPRRGMCRDDYEVFADLAARMGFERAFTEGRTSRQWIEHLMAGSDVPDPDEFRRTGIRLIESERSGCDAFARDPEGCPLDTPSGKVEVESLAYAKATGFPAAPAWATGGRQVGAPNTKEGAAGAFSLLLITPKSGLRTHSQMLMQAPEGQAGNGDGRLEMHPDDARARGLADGEEADLRGERGMIRVTVKVTEGIMRGTVSLAEGLWHLPRTTGGLSGSPNVLTSMDGTGAYHACVMHAIPVVAQAAR